MTHYLLIYDVVDDYGTRRMPWRDEHLARAWTAHAAGDLVLGGALDDPLDTALLLFRGDTPAAAEAFARADPYVRNGLVRRWSIRVWRTVVGDEASQPIRPSPDAGA